MQKPVALKEISALKNKLYTNITHEFRTPLTVISGLTDQLASSKFVATLRKGQKDRFEKNIALITRNSKNLLGTGQSDTRFEQVG